MIVLLFLHVLAIVSAKNVPTFGMIDAPKLFEDFIKTYEKVYNSSEHKAMRFGIFQKNLEVINDLNKISEHADFGINEFADLTREEFVTRHTGYKPSEQELLGQCKTVNEASENNDSRPEYEEYLEESVEIPDQFDWRDKGVVTRVGKQVNCGSCWTFGVTGNVESANAIKTGQLLELSEQQLLDCDKDGANGCQGGDPQSAFGYVIEKGVMSYADYPYEDTDQNGCRYDAAKVSVRISGCLSFDVGEDKLVEYLFNTGPITIGIAAGGLANYVSGVVADPLCETSAVNHSVLVVGYGIENGVPYWLVKNSWGEQWGESGYFKLQRGINCLNLQSNPRLAAVV